MISSSTSGVFPGQLPKVFHAQTAAVSQSTLVLEIPFFKKYLSRATVFRLADESTPVAGVAGLTVIGTDVAAGVPTAHLAALCELYQSVKAELNTVLQRKRQDREFIDQRTRACYELNCSLQIPFTSSRYRTILGDEDTDGRVIVGANKGPAASFEVSPLPAHLEDLKAEFAVKTGGFKWLSDFAVPSVTLMDNGQPIPAHLGDLVMHMFRHWDTPAKLTYYAAAIESEEDASYLRLVLDRAEALLLTMHPEYAAGSVRVVVAYQSPRGMFRTAEVAKALNPYYAGAALDWDEYLAASVRLFKEDANCRLPAEVELAEAETLLRFLNSADQEDLLDMKIQREILLLNLAHSVPLAGSDIADYRSRLSDCLRLLASWLAETPPPAGLAVSHLAALETVRWQLWQEVHYKRIPLDAFLAVVMEECISMRKSTPVIGAEKWHTPALDILILLVTNERPAENAMELFVPFKLAEVRMSDNPREQIDKIDSRKCVVSPFTERFCAYFDICGNAKFCTALANNMVLDLRVAEELFMSLSDYDIAAVNDLQLAPLDSSNLRGDLWSLIAGRLVETTMYATGERIRAALSKHNVTGATISISSSEGQFQALPLGEAVRGSLPVTEHTRFEVASLSKSIGSCFAIEYFMQRKIPLDTRVNELLAKHSSPYRIPSGDANHPSWGDDVTIAHLMEHSALNMHYVNGIPLGEEMPSVLDLISGKFEKKYGYVPVCASREPGVVFGYSGGGFLVLQHLIETMEGQSVVELTASFTRALGMTDFTFENKTEAGFDYAAGYRESGEPVDGGRKMHPAFPAGGLGTAMDMTSFLTKLTTAFNSSTPGFPISHDTAIHMLRRVDRGSQKFMGAGMGLGIFISEAGPNKLAIHQGANDGFRCLFVHCFTGPDRGKGFCVHCNAELNGIFFIAEVAHILFHELKIRGVYEEKFRQNFSAADIPSEQIVNIGYKGLIFDAFEPDLPEKIVITGPKDPWADYNLAVGGAVKYVTNQRFARAENLLSPMLPTFDPKLFGRMGKIMDSWESVRHNPLPYDTLVFLMIKPSEIHFVQVSTQFHLGNQAQQVAVDGRAQGEDEWHPIIPRCNLDGHSKLLVKSINDPTKMFSEIRVLNIPDGGISRLGLYSKTSLSSEFHPLFLPLDTAKCERFTDAVPGTVKPLAPEYITTPEEIQETWDSIPVGWEVDLASAALGGEIHSASDQHYGPAKHLLSPFPPLSMFDGLESARSRIPGHSENVVVKLGRQAGICRIEMDMTYFVNNNPLDVAIYGACNDLTDWVLLLPKKRIKGYRGNFAEFPVDNTSEFTHIKVMTFPCGGFNRLKVFAVKK